MGLDGVVAEIEVGADSVNLVGGETVFDGSNVSVSLLAVLGLAESVGLELVEVEDCKVALLVEVSDAD